MLPDDVLEDIRKKVEGGLGPLTKGGSDDLAGALFGKAQGAADQLSGFASVIAEWVAFARELIRAEVRDVVERELADLRPAGSKTIDALSTRVDRLEREAAGAPGRITKAKPTSKKASGGKKKTSGGKVNRKAVARDLEALTARVDRLEREAPGAPVPLRTPATKKPTSGKAKRTAAAATPSRSTVARKTPGQPVSSPKPTRRAGAARPASATRTSRSAPGR
jgi:hypothetical protein